MNQDPNMLWLSVSPNLKCFDRRLLSRLTSTVPVRHWAYSQTVDEPCCIASVVASLHEYVSDRAALERRSGQAHYQVHLLGHGVSGIVALLYARRYPQHVASLTLLSVNPMPAINWQAHYYALRQLLPCSREIILAQMTKLLFNQQQPRFAKALSCLLAKNLDSSLTLHSLAHHATIPSGGTNVPLLVCNGDADSIVCSQEQSLWHDYMKPGDRLWHCPEGKHFFHFDYAKETADVIKQHVRQAQLQPVQNSTAAAEVGAGDRLVTHHS